jgi:hypothetical protein
VWSKTVSPVVIGRHDKQHHLQKRDPKLQNYEEMESEDSIMLAPSHDYSNNKHHRSMGGADARKDLTLTLEFMVKEREKALRYRLPLQSNKL